MNKTGKKTTCYARVLRALKRRERVTRKNAIERGWCENLTATVADLRKEGWNIETINAGDYTRYRLNKPHLVKRDIVIYTTT